MKLSKQRQWQLKMIAAGRCPMCGKPKGEASMCVACLIKQRERGRKRGKFKKRYDSLSYRLETTNASA